MITIRLRNGVVVSYNYATKYTPDKEGIVLKTRKDEWIATLTANGDVVEGMPPCKITRRKEKKHE